MTVLQILTNNYLQNWVKIIRKNRSSLNIKLDISLLKGVRNFKTLKINLS